MKKLRYLFPIMLLLLTSGCGSSKASSSVKESESSTEISESISSLSESVTSTTSESVVSSSSEVISFSSSTSKSSSSKKSSSSSPQVVNVKSIKLNVTSKDMLVNETLTLKATITPTNASDQTITWDSSNPSVASVENGVVKALSKGSTNIRVTTRDGNKTATCQVNVSEPAPIIPDYCLHGQYNGSSEWSDIAITPNGSSKTEWAVKNLSLHANDVFKVHMSGDTWYGYSDIKTSSPKGLLAKASSDDNIKVLVDGNFDIYSDYNVSDGGHLYIAKIEKTVPVTGVTLNITSKTLEINETVTLTPSISPIDATNKNVTWTTSNSNVATVNNGIVTAVGEGKATITVKTSDGNKTATCAITVNKAPVTIPDYCLHGQYNGSSEWSDIKLSQNSESKTEWMIKELTLHANDVFKVHMSGDTWYGYSDIKSSVSSGLVSKASSDDNIKVVSGGVYDIYANTTYSDSGHIYLSKKNEPTSDKFYYQINSGSFYELPLSNAGEYSVSGVSFSQNAVVMFKKSDTKINVNVDTASGNNCVTYSSGGYAGVKIKQASQNSKIVLKDNNNTYTVFVSEEMSATNYYLTGTIGGETIEKTNYKYTFAIDDVTSKLAIFNVQAKKGDTFYLRNKNGDLMKNSQSIIYSVYLSKDCKVNIYCDPTNANKSYLTFVYAEGGGGGETETDYSIILEIPDWVNIDNYCIWAWVWDANGNSKWVKSTEYGAVVGRTACKIIVPENTIGIKVVRAKSNSSPTGNYDSLTDITHQSGDITIDPKNPNTYIVIYFN